MKPQEIIEQALRLTTVSDAVVIVRERSSVNLRWAGNSLTTNGHTLGRDGTVIAIVDNDHGRCAGVKRGVVAQPEDLIPLVHKAEQSAREARPSPDAGPLVADMVSHDYDDAAVPTAAAVFDSFAADLGETFDRCRGEGRELFGYAEHDITTTYVGTSAGVRLRHVQPTGRVDITGKSHNRSRSTWIGVQTCDYTDVNMHELDSEMTQRLAWAARSHELDPGRYDVIVPPVALADLMVYLYWSMSARDAAEGRTVFSRPGGNTRVHESLTEQPISLLSDPNYPGMKCEPFVVAESSSSTSSVFDNGLPLQRTEWISQGRLATLGQTRHSAQLTGMPVTPPIDNLILEHASGAGGLMDLVRDVDDGLLLTTLWYIREVDPQTLLLTGLTRDGVYVVRSGEIIGSANNFRFNESPVNLLARVAAASTTNPVLTREWSDYFTRTAMPAVRIPDFNMSTVSQAS